MKLKQTLGMLVLVTAQYTTMPAVNFKVPKGVKQPARAITVVGSTPKSYQVVYTKITKDPSDESGKPVVVRSVKSVKNSGTGSAPINEELAIPQADVILSAGVLPDAAAKVAGLIDPRAGAAAKAGSAILDEGLNIAGQELTKKYNLNAFEIKLIELLPTEYYYVESSDNSVQVKSAFLPALEKYTQLLTGYSDIADSYNKAAVKYNKLQSALPAQRPPPNKPAERADWNQKFEAAKAVYDNEVMPVLRKKVAIESQLTNYSLHRIALMASQDEPGDGCKATGEKGWEGPWSLYLYYFIGSKQTNRIKIDFCAQKGVTQDFAIRLNGNDQDAQGLFLAGGVNLEATDNNTIKFPVEIAAGQMNWNSKKSAKYDWFDEMIVNENGGDIATYLYPYDLFNLEQKRLAMQAEKNDARSKENIEKFNAAIDELKEAMGGKKGGGLVDKIEDKEEEKGLLDVVKDTIKDKVTGITVGDKETRNFYAILGINKNASEADIKDAYRKLARTKHPDRNESPNAQAEWVDISDAYATLLDKDKRAEYDANFTEESTTTAPLLAIGNSSISNSLLPPKKSRVPVKTKKEGAGGEKE